MTAASPRASASTGVRSLNCTPGSGKSGTSRISDAMTLGDVARSGAHWLSFQRSMFQPAPHRVGLPLTAYIFVDVSSVRC